VRPSLTRRLLTLYVVTIMVVVGVAGGTVWVLMRRALYAGLDAGLNTEALALASRLDAEYGQVEFEEGEGRSLISEPSSPSVQILDDRGRIVFSSPVPADGQTFVERLSGVGPEGSPMWFTEHLAPAEGLSRVLALHVVVPREDAAAGDGDDSATVGAWVVVARSLAPIDQTLAQLASVLASAVGAAMLAAFAGGLVVARRGTQPVRALAESVGRVDPACPELQLEAARVPVELEPIVRTTQRLLKRVRGELLRQRQLTADVAHDLRTPVAGVRTLLDVCLQRERSLPEYVAAMEKARAALRELSRLLDDVLTLSRLDSCADEPVWTQVRVKDVVAAAVATVQPLAAARNVGIDITACPGAEIRTDRGKLVKIVSNLLSNAVEYSAAGAAVHIAVQVEQGALQIAVTDGGPGVPAEMRNRIFDRFVRADAARAPGDGHHGLGLPIAAGLARLLDAEVKLDAQHECGSRFVVRLPLS